LPGFQHRIMPNFTQKSCPVTSGHLNITEDQVGEVLSGKGETDNAGIGFENIIPHLAKRLSEGHS
jgi:hypothetical protein